MSDRGPAEPRARHGVVLSGNGSNGAYEVGVLKALIEGASPASRGAPISPAFFCGTSVGTLNAAVMVAESERTDIAAVEALERLWLERIAAPSRDRRAPTTPRFRGNPFEYANPATYFPNPLRPLGELGTDLLVVGRDFARRAGQIVDSFDPTWPFTQLQKFAFDYDWSILTDFSPLEGLVRETFDPAKIRRSEKVLRITAANVGQGTAITLANRHLDDEHGRTRIAAAMRIPGGMQPATIDGEHFVDGAMLMNHPLGPALEAGREVLGDRRDRLVVHAVYLDQEHGGGAPLAELPGSFSTVYRLFMLAFSRALNADIERAQDTNRSLLLLDVLEEVDPAFAATSGEGSSEFVKLWRRLNRNLTDRVPIEIHRYRSARHLGGIMDLFLFDRERIERLIRRGYRDAETHDCEEAGCVLLSAD